MLKLIVLRVHKQKTSQKIVFFFLKECFLTIIYESSFDCHMKTPVELNKVLTLLKIYIYGIEHHFQQRF